MRPARPYAVPRPAQGVLVGGLVLAAVAEPPLADGARDLGQALPGGAWHDGGADAPPVLEPLVYDARAAHLLPEGRRSHAHLDAADGNAGELDLLGAHPEALGDARTAEAHEEQRRLVPLAASVKAERDEPRHVPRLPAALPRGRLRRHDVVRVERV